MEDLEEYLNQLDIWSKSMRQRLKHMDQQDLRLTVHCQHLRRESYRVIERSRQIIAESEAFRKQAREQSGVRD